jgi:hypothetical protein
MNGSQITESDGGDAGERGTGAEGVLKQEDKVLGLVPYKEPVNFYFFLVFSIFFTSTNFVGHVSSIFNSVLNKNLKIDSSFFLKKIISNI